MATNSYFPSISADQIIWLTHYAAKLPINGPTCEITAPDITATLTEIQYYIWILQHWHPATQSDAKEATAYKYLVINDLGDTIIDYPNPTIFLAPPAAVKPGIQKRLFSQIVRIKASLNYNEAIGQDLGIIATPDNSIHLVPDFTLTVEMGIDHSIVRIDFNKYGHEGIWIESRRGAEEWSFLAIDTLKPYLDERPLAEGSLHETREYRMRWWDKSLPQGEWSAVQKVVLGE